MNAVSIRLVFKVNTASLSCGHIEIKQWLCVESITQRQVWHTCGRKHKQPDERTTIPVKLIAGRRRVFHQKLRNVLNSAPRREVQKKKQTASVWIEIRSSGAMLGISVRKHRTRG